MRKFQFATINILGMFVAMSDAESPTEHHNACIANDDGEYTPCIVIRVNGFSNHNEMHEYCAKRQLVVL